MAYEPPRGGTEEDLPEDNSPLSGDRYAAPSGGPTNVGNVKKGDPGDYGTLPRSYLNVLTKASAQTYSEEIPNAGWGKILLGVAIVTLVTFGMKILLSPLTQRNMDDLKQKLAEGGQYAENEPWRTLFPLLDVANSPLFALIVPITFFFGAAILYFFSRIARDKEAADANSAGFKTHAYLLSLSYTPLRSLAALTGLLSLLPVVGLLGSLISLGLFLFQLYSAGLSMQASQKLAPGKAQQVAFVPWIVGLALLICATSIVLVTVLGPLLRRG
jgi:hypothetical protein